METKKRWGGARQFSGRKKIDNFRQAISLRLSKQALLLLAEFAKGTGLTKTQLIENSIFNNLSTDNENIIYCPQCHKPVGFRSLMSCQGRVNFKCKCGHEFEESL